MADAMMMGGQKSEMQNNMWWLIAAGGVGLALVAYIISFFNGFEDIQDKEKASEVFRMLGFVAFCTSAALMAALQTGMSLGARVALLLGAGYFTMMGASMSSMFRGMFGGMM